MIPRSPAPRCGFSTETLRRFEGGSRHLTTDQLDGLKEALEAAAVELINSSELGVKLKKQG